MPDEIKLQLNDPKVLEAFKWYVDQAVLFKDTEAAYRLVRILPRYLAATPPESPELGLDYQEMILKARFIALDRLKIEEIVELLQSNFPLVFNLENYDLWAAVKAKLVAEPVYAERDEMKRKIRDAILSSEQTLTDEEIAQDDTSIKGTVKNWLADYNRSVGTGKIETLKMSQYLTNSPTTRKLSAASRAKLDYLLKFYEKTKLSSLDYDGIEEPMLFNVDGKMFIFEEGQVEKPSQDVLEMVARAEAAEEMISVKSSLEERYKGSDAEKKSIEGKEKAITKSIGTDFKSLADQLFKSIRPSPTSKKKIDAVEIEALLKILAEQGKLEDLIEDKRFNGMVVSFLEKRGRPSEMEGFRVNPRAPQYVSALLQTILKDGAGMNDDNSGRIGMKIFNILSKGKKNKYRGLVYFDLGKKEFSWSD